MIPPACYGIDPPVPPQAIHTLGMRLLIIAKALAKVETAKGTPPSPLHLKSRRQDRPKPLRYRLLKMTQLSVLENGHLTVGHIHVAVIVNEHMR